jgi:hypothetical protein
VRSKSRPVTALTAGTGNGRRLPGGVYRRPRGPAPLLGRNGAHGQCWLDRRVPQGVQNGTDPGTVRLGHGSGRRAGRDTGGRRVLAGPATIQDGAERRSTTIEAHNVRRETQNLV